jgi:hypothetical protein
MTEPQPFPVWRRVGGLALFSFDLANGTKVGAARTTAGAAIDRKGGLTENAGGLFNQ